MQQSKLSLSNTLILVSIFFTVFSFVFPGIEKTFWMHSWFFYQWSYHIWLLQFFTSQFFHGDMLHLLFNGVFVFYFGNILESIIWYKKMLVFFILNSVFLWIVLTFLALWVTVWISWFALAILTYYTLLLKQRNNPEYKGGITAIVINIVIGLSPWISFLGHFGGMLFWTVFFFSQKKK